MHLLVTGGCGFIGSHLAHALIASGHRVRILDNLSSGSRENAPAGAEVIVGDITDAETVTTAMRGIDGVFHLAAIASVQECNAHWLSSHRTNLTGTVTVFEAAAKAALGPVPVVYASSAAVYGNCTDTPLGEDAVTLPLTSYGQDKLSAEHYARIGAQIHRMSSVGLRFFNVYGPGQNPNSPYSGVISKFIDAAKQGSAVTLFGDGQQTRDFIFVDDIVVLLMQSMQYLLGHTSGPVHTVLNGATGHATSLLELLATIEELAGDTIERGFAQPRTGDIRHSLGNPQKAMELLGFRASTPLKHGLRATLSTPYERRKTLRFPVPALEKRPGVEHAANYPAHVV